MESWTKSAKLAEKVSSYRPILSRLFEKWFLASLKRLLESSSWVSNPFEDKKFCSAFLYVTQIFDKVVHPGFIFKLKSAPCYQVLHPYFTVKYNLKITSIFSIHSGVPQGSVLGPVLYQIFTVDLPNTAGNFTATATLPDDIIARSKVSRYASDKIQKTLNNIQAWLREWRLKVNEAKSQHVTFIIRKESCATVTHRQTLLNNLVCTLTED